MGFDGCRLFAPAMPDASLVLDHLLSHEAVRIGRLVLNPNSPVQDFHDSDARSVEESDVVETQQSSFSQILQRQQESRLHAFLTALASAYYKDKSQSTVALSTVRTKTCKLRNSSDFFEEICQSRGTRKWLEKAIRRQRKVYMVVGLQIVTDARSGNHDEQSREIGGEVTAPVSVAATVASHGGVAVPSEGVDPGSAGISMQQDVNFVAPGEQIYAVQYRKVEFKWYSSRKIENAELERGNRWKIYNTLRSVSEANEEDVVEARMGDIDGTDIDSLYEGFGGVIGQEGEEVLLIPVGKLHTESGVDIHVEGIV